MKHTALLSLFAAALLASPATGASDTNKWTFDASIYGLAVGMSGDVGIGPINADVDVGFDKIWDNLEFGAMGTVRVGYDRWALTTDVLYMGLQASKNRITAEFDQWMVEPSISYRVCKYFEPLAGVRYNSLSGELRGPNIQLPQLGPGLLPRPNLLAGPGVRSGTQDWWDPIVGASVSVPLGKKFSFNVRSDIGGFGVGSDLTWQAFPYFSWHFIEWGSFQAGYRWLYMDYETGSDANRFTYDVLSQGLQLGITFHF